MSFSEKDADIIKISALSGTKEFITFITPGKHIALGATKENHLEVKEGKLCFDGQPVDEGPPKERLVSFTEWLKALETPVVLVGHNFKSFIGPLLKANLQKHGLEEVFGQNVVGYIDSLKFFRTVFPARKSHALKSLAKELIEINLEARQSGQEKVQTLQMLMNHARDKAHTLGLNLELNFTDFF